MATSRIHWFWKWLQPQRRRKLVRRRRAQVETLEQRSLLATLLQSYFPAAVGPQDLAAVGYRVAATDNFFVVGSKAAAGGYAQAGEAYVFNTAGGFVARLSNPTPATDDAFGSAVAASGSLVVVGAYLHDDGLPNSGAAYVFHADTGTLLFTLANPTQFNDDEFGSAVAIDGNLIAVGARSDNAGLPNSGAVHLFAADTGQFLRTVENPAAGLGDGFGSALALQGNALVVGAPHDVSGGVDAGRAFVFNAATGALLNTLENPAPAAGDQFGSAVALAGATVAVGAPLDDTIATDAGSVYLFDTATGGFLRSLNHPVAQAGDQLGVSVGLHGDQVLAGAPNVDDNPNGADVGRAFVFSASVGNLLQTLQSSTPAAADKFGLSVAISSAGIIVGNPGSDVAANDGGAAALFEAGTYALTATLVAPTLAANDGLGSSVAISGDWSVIGNPGEDTPARNGGLVQVYSIASGNLMRDFLPPPNNPQAAFGTAVAVSTNVLAVGAPGWLVGGVAAGAVLLFDLNTGLLLRTIENPTPAAGDQFGRSVDFEGTILLIGAPGDDTQATDNGSAYTFNSTTGVLDQTLVNPLAAAGDQFGFAVAMASGTAVIGAPYADITVADSGRAYLFNVTTGALLHMLAPSGTRQAGENFGFAVDLAGENVAVGSPYYDSGFVDSGRAQLFATSTGAVRTALNVTPSSLGQLGYSVALSGNKLLVGEPGKGTSGVAVLVDAATLERIETINNPTPASGERFGQAVALAGSFLQVGAPGEITVNYGQGAAYSYRRTPSLTATLSAGVLTIADSVPLGLSISHTLTVVRDGNDVVITDSNEEFSLTVPVGTALENDNRSLRVPLNLFDGLTINTLYGNDTVTLNLSGGDVIPNGGVSFDGGGGTGSGVNDSLILLGGVQGAVLYDYTGATSGSIVLANFGNVTYAGTEALRNTGTSTTTTFKLPAVGTHSAELEDDGDAGNELLQFDSLSRTLVPTIFRSPSSSLVVDANSISDLLMVRTLPQLTASLALGTAADRLGSLTFAGSNTLAANLSVTAFVAQSIQFDSNTQLNASGSGSVALTTNYPLILSGSAGITTTDGNILLSADVRTALAGLPANGVGVQLNTAAVVQATGNGNVTIVGRASQVTATNSQYGVQVVGANARISAAAGTVNVTGTGGGAAATNNSNYGVYLVSGGAITGGTGAVTVTGTGGGVNTAAGGGNAGLRIEGTGSRISTTGGAIAVTGNGGGDDGLMLFAGAEIVAGGMGDVTVIGTAGNAQSSSKLGIWMSGVGVRIGSAGGNVRVEGWGGGTLDSGFSSRGISMQNGATIAAGGLGTTTVFGRADRFDVISSAGQYGISLDGTAKISSAGGAVAVTGIGGGKANWSSNYGVFATNSSEISAGGTGSLTVEGTGAALGSGNNHGVFLDTLSKILSSGGPVLVRGTAGGGSSANPSKGVLLQGNAVISGGGLASVIVEGRGSNNTASTGSNNLGVHLSGGDVLSNGGDITVRGWGGGFGGGSSFNDGVGVASGGEIYALGAGNVTVEGFGGNTTGTTAGGRNAGVTIADSTSRIRSVTGAVTITGVGGGVGSSSSQNQGIVLANSGFVTSAGNITLTGSAGVGNFSTVGIELTNGAPVNSTAGLVKLTGTTLTKSASNYGISVSGGIVGMSGSLATVEMIADAINISGSNSVLVHSSRTVTLKPLTPGLRISLGAADSPNTHLGFTTTELDSITAGKIQIGDATSGEITLSSTVSKGTAANLSLTAGHNRNIALGNFAINLTAFGNSSVTLNVTGTGAITAASTIGGVFAAGASGSVTIIAEAGNIGSSSAAIVVNAANLNIQTQGSFYAASAAPSTLSNNSTFSAGGTGYLSGSSFLLTGTDRVGDNTSLYLVGNVVLYTMGLTDTFAGIGGDFGARIRSIVEDPPNGAPSYLTLSGESGTHDLRGLLGDFGSNIGLIGVTKRGGSTLVLGGTNWFNLPLRIEGGVVVAQNSSALGLATPAGTAYTQVLPGGALRLDTPVTIATEPLRISGPGYLNDPALSVNSATSVTATGPITLEGDATIGGPLGFMTLGGVIDDGASTFGLTKSGGSSVLLTGINLYNGPTLVRDSGSLNINGSLVSATTVEGPGRLGGTGTIHNQVTVNSGGTISGGSGLTVNRPGQPAVLLAGDAKLSAFIGSTGNSLKVNGGVTLGSPGNYPRLDLGLSDTLSAGKYIILQNDGTDPIDGFLVAGFGSSLPAGTPLPEGAAISGNFASTGFAITISYVGGTGNDIEITVNSKPTIATVPTQVSFEDASPVTINLSGITAGSESQALQVTASSSNPALIPTPSIDYTSPATTGALTFQPVENMNGSAIITVTVRDAGLDGVLGTLDDGLQTTQFSVGVNPINDAPSFVSGGAVVATNFFPQSRPAWATVISGGPNEAAQLVNFNVTGYTNTGLFATPPAVASNGTLSFTPAVGQFGSSTVTLFAQDNGGTANGGIDASPPQTFTITVTQPATLQVMWFAPTTTGGVFHFSHDIDPSLLNLYDVQGNLLGPADIEFRGDISGVIKGSAVVDPGLQQLTFVSTNGRLPADNYTVMLRSAANGVRDTLSILLDGDANGTAGGDFVHTFSVTPPAANAVTVSIPNFARGPEQSVNLPALASGISLSFSNGGGITAATFELRYNPALLTITAANVAAGLPVGATVNLNTSTPGVAVITFNSPTALAAGTTQFVNLQASVPSTAPYRNKHVLDLANIVLNAGAIPALDDDGVQVVAFFADVTGNGTYSAQDASLLARLAVGIDTGLEDFALLDPTIIGDITGNGAFSATDTSLMLQAAVGITVPELPTPLPTISLTQGGPDPKLSIPQNLTATAGGSLLIPVDIDSIVNLTGNGLASADLVIYYDPTVLEITSAALGSLVAQRGGWLISSRIDPLAGRIDLSLAGQHALEGEFIGELVQLQATVKADAPAGASAINLAATSRSRSTQLNEGFLTLIPAPTDAANDAIDGRVTITAANDNPPNAPAVRRIGEQLHITGTAGNDRILVSQVDAEHVRVRIGNRVLGTFAAPQGLAIDGLTGQDFIYVAPTAPAAVIAASINHDDLIFAGDNTLLVEPAAQTELTAAPANQLNPYDLALLQLLAGWHDSHQDNGPPSSRTGVRRR